jgi:hexosaminidase
MPTEEKVETMIFPRLLGMAERLWSPASNRDTDAFLARADAFLGRLDVLGRAYNVPLPQPSEAAMVLSGGGSLSFAPSPIPGAAVRYAVDGTDPTVDSPAFETALAQLPQLPARFRIFRISPNLTSFGSPDASNLHGAVGAM